MLLPVVRFTPACPHDDVARIDCAIERLNEQPSASSAVLPDCHTAATSRLHQIVVNYCGANLAAYVVS
jgi:hypothetical protein